MTNNLISIGLFIDGGYYCKINDGLRPLKYRLNLKKLCAYICEQIAVKYGLDKTQCFITESHFFRGRFRMHEAKKKNRLEADTWNVDEKDSTSPALKEEVTMHIDLDEKAREDADFLSIVCDSIA